MFFFLLEFFKFLAGKKIEYFCEYNSWRVGKKSTLKLTDDRNSYVIELLMGANIIENLFIKNKINGFKLFDLSSIQSCYFYRGARALIHKEMKLLEKSRKKKYDIYIKKKKIPI